MAKLNRVRVQWASVQADNPNTTYDPRWEVEAILSSEQAAVFVDAGVKVKEDDGVLSLRFKRKVSGDKKGGGTYTNKPPQVVDAAKAPFTDLIGNGSLCNIAYSLRDWDGFGAQGVAADLNAVQVLELVPYGGDQGADEFDDEGTTETIEDSKEEEDIF